MPKKTTAAKTSVTLKVVLPSELHRRLKMSAAADGVTITAVVLHLLDKGLPKLGR